MAGKEKTFNANDQLIIDKDYFANGEAADVNKISVSPFRFHA